MTKIAFFGSSEYSNIILEKLLSLPKFKVSLIVTKIDKPFGRDQTITPNPVAKFAKEHNLELLQIEEFSTDVKLKIKKLKLDLGLCVAFGPPFFDQEMIDLFPQKIVNIHPSPLPKYRGATPGPWQIINGEKNSAVTFFQIDILPDHGPIIAQIPFEISLNDTTDSFYKKAFSLAASNINLILESELAPQDHSQKSYYPKLSKDMAKIDWTWDENKIERFIRALFPWPIAWTLVANNDGDLIKMKAFSAKFDKKLIIETVQLEGKTKTKWSEISSHYKIIK